jgi:NAD(P)H-binding
VTQKQIWESLEVSTRYVDMCRRRVPSRTAYFSLNDQSQLELKSSFNTGWFIYLVLNKVIADKNIQEDLVRESGFDYVIVRPTGLSDKSAEGKYRVGKLNGMGTISRADVAAFVVKCLDDDTWLNQCPSIMG